MRNTLTILTLITFILLSSCSPSANDSRKEDATADSTMQSTTAESVVYRTETLIISRVSQHCYVHTSYLNTQDFGKVPCNGMLVADENEVIVFDTPADNESSRELIRFVSEKLKSAIAGVVATHFHDDCVGGLSVFREHNIPAYASNRTVALLAERKPDIRDIHPFTDSLELNVGKDKVLVNFFGEGHTKDNVVGWFETDAVLFGGCLIKEVGAGKGNLADANVHAWPETVMAIKRQLPNVMIIVPGHGEPGGPELLDYTIELFQEMASTEAGG